MRNAISLLIVLTIAATVGFGCKSEEEKKKETEMRERPAKFAAARQEFSRKPAKVALVQQPYLKSKIAVLSSTDGKSIDPNSPFGYRDVSGLKNIASPMTSTPEEVNSVVLKECRTVGKTIYRLKDNPSREIPATLIDCEVTIIDRTIQSVVFVKTFRANPAENVKIWEKSESMSVIPTEEIDAFLKSLPQQ